MARTRTAKFIHRKGRTWYAALDIPKAVRPAFSGKPRFYKSLRTESETEAENLARPLIAYWKDCISAARRGDKPFSIPHPELAEQWRADFKQAQGVELETLQMVLPEVVDELKFKTSSERHAFEQIVRGEDTAFKPHIAAWINSQKDLTPKTLDMKRSDVERFVERLPTSNLVTRDSLVAWVDEISAERKRNTVARILSAVRGFWGYLESKGEIRRDDSPFDQVKLPKQSKSKKSLQDSRKAFAPSDVVELHKAADENGDDALRDLIWIGMWTGCRIEEICSLTVQNVFKDCIRIEDAKTQSGCRDVPRHPKLNVSGVAAPHCRRDRPLRVDTHPKRRSAFRNVRKEFVPHGAWC